MEVRWLEGIPGEIWSPPDARSPAVRDESRTRRRPGGGGGLQRHQSQSYRDRKYMSAVSLIIQQGNPDLAEAAMGVVFCADNMGMFDLK